jgi:hypothetical protein
VIEEFRSVEIVPNDLPRSQNVICSLRKAVQERCAQLRRKKETGQATVIGELTVLEGTLKVAQEEVEKRMERLAERKLESVRVLATPVEPVGDESFVAGIESVNERANEIVARLEEEEELRFVELLGREVAEEETEVKRRRAAIEKRKGILDEQRRNAERRQVDSERKMQNQRENARPMAKEAILEAEPSLMTEDECTARLQSLVREKQEGIDRVTGVIDELEAKFKAERSLKEHNWNRKMARIGQYQEQLAEKESVAIEIRQEEEAMTELEYRKRAIEQEMAQLAKRKKESVSSHNRLAKEKGEAFTHHVELEAAKVKRLKRQKRRLERRREIEAREKEVKDGEAKATESERIVLRLEGQLERARISTDKVVNELSTEAQGIGKFVEALRYDCVRQDR